MAEVSLRFFVRVYLLFCIASYRVICEISHGNELPAYSMKNDHRLPHNVLQDDCEQSLNNPQEFLLVSTLDGRVTALDPADGGRVVWSITTEPGEMLSSSISRLEVPNRGHWVRIIPSLDGNLYKFDGKIIEPIPLSTDTLLKNSFKLGDDIVVIGGKETRSYGINLQTGKLRYICNMEGCSSIGEMVSSTEDILVIQRHTQIVRAVHSRTGVEQWNFSVGEHRISMAKGIKNDFTNSEINGKFVLDQGNVFITCEEKDCSSASRSSFSLKVVMPDGFIAAVDGMSKHFIWSHKLPSPIVNVWQLQEDTMWSLDLFSHETLVGMDQNNAETLPPPLLYIGFHEKQLYIKHSEEMKHQVEGAVKSYLLSSQLVMPQVQWKPYIATAQSRTPFVDIGRKDVLNDDPTAVILKEDFDYPYDSGFYLYGSTKLISVIDNSSQCSANELQEEETFDQIVIVSLWHWWKEVVAIAIGSSVFVHLLVTRHALKKINLMKESSNSQEIQIVNPCVLSGNSELTVVMESKDGKNESKLGQYTSRYLTDFEPLECLGKGGFGVVFEAKNKIDDCNYAVKRIGLKNREDALEKVMREVKALAKLDHSGIVRYFNAWLESPPPGWQEEKDKEWDEWSKMSATPFSSTAASATENGERIILNTVNPLKPYDAFSNDASRGFSVNRLEDESGSFSLENLPSEQQPIHSAASDSFEIIFNHSRKNAGDASSIRQEEHQKGKFNYPFSESKRNKEMSLSNYNHHNNINDSLIISLEDSGCGDRSRSTEEELLEKDSMKDKQLIISSKSKVTRPSVLNFHERKLYESSTSRIYLYIQMQLCRKESLKDWLSCNTEHRDHLEVLDIFDQIVSAVQYVHECGLMHRDLKPSNIFFSMDGTIKVGDFGLVTAVADAHTPAGNYTDNVNPLVKHTDQVGTQLYMSPEQISGYTYSHKVDIFSLGLIFFELLTPFSTQSERIKVLLNVRRQKFPNDFRKNKYEECQFASKLLSHNPEERPSAAEIIQHPLFKDFQPQPPVINRAKRRRTLSQRMSSSSSDCDLNPSEGTENLLTVPS